MNIKQYTAKGDAGGRGVGEGDDGGSSAGVKNEGKSEVIFIKPPEIKEIIIKKQWYDRLITILDELDELENVIKKDTDYITIISKLSYLNGYIRSLDERFKK